MSRFSDSDRRLTRFLARNEGAVLSGLVREASAKAYRRPAVRAALRHLMPKREPEKWVFLVGCYNSGTTILRRLMEAHPAISAFPLEGVEFTDAFPDLEAGGWPRMLYRNRALWELPEAGAAARVERAIRDWSPWWARGATVFLEKSIDHSTRIRWLDAHFPNVHFISTLRNGYCVCEGILRRTRPRGPAADEIGDAYPPELVAQQWVALADRVDADMPTVQRGHSLRYEDLTRDPVRCLEEIFGFLGLAAPEMSWTEGALTIAGQSHEIANQNANSLARLSAADLAAMTPILKEAMLRHGYALEDSAREESPEISGVGSR